MGCLLKFQSFAVWDLFLQNPLNIVVYQIVKAQVDLFIYETLQEYFAVVSFVMVIKSFFCATGQT